MKAHIVLAHPEPRSFNGRLATISRNQLLADGWQVTLSDLYADGFDPCEGPGHYRQRADTDQFHAQTEQRHNANVGTTPADVAEECERLLGSDLLVVHFPLWWFGMPAILKGWMDRVFVYGAMYSSQMRYDAGICRGKNMIACVTTGASADSCAHDGREGDSRLHLWPALFPFHYIGFDVLQPLVLHGVGGVASIEQHEDGMSDLDRYQENWRQVISQTESRDAIPFNRESDFDDNKRLRPDAPVHSPFIAQTARISW